MLLAALLCPAAEAVAQGRGLRHLKSWANELPVSGKGARRRSIFDDRELRASLVGLMGAEEFARMLAHFETMPPADLVDGHLIITGWPEHDAQSAYLVVKLDSGDVWAARTDDGAATWFAGRVPKFVLNTLETKFFDTEHCQR